MLNKIPREDTYLHKGLRRQLLKLLEEKGITDKKVLDAMGAVPRHFFLDPAFEQYAYKDRPFTISENQTISHPFTVALQTQLLEIKKFDKVLEVGTGSTYQACVLAQMGIQLYTIERQRELYDLAGTFFYVKKFLNIKRFFGDGFLGLPSYGPFDKIIVTCGATIIPPKLVEQLKPGGILVIPVGDELNQKMLKIVKAKDGTLTTETFGDFKFVPMLEGRNYK